MTSRKKQTTQNLFTLKNNLPVLDMWYETMKPIYICNILRNM